MNPDYSLELRLGRNKAAAYRTERRNKDRS